MERARVELNVDRETWKAFRKQLKKQKLGTARAYLTKKVEEVVHGEAGDKENTDTVHWIKMQKVRDKWIVVPL